MKKRAIRFGVIDGNGGRAATWKLLVETTERGEEVYLICRALGGSLKTSFHSSGQWHTAYTGSCYERLLSGDPAHPTRFVEKWNRPTAVAPGITLAFRIVTPSGSVTSAVDPKDKSLIEIPCAPPGQAIEASVLFTAEEAPVTEWPGKRSMRTSLIGSVRLATGELVWVVYRAIDIPDLSRVAGSGVGRYFKGRGKADLEAGSLRALAFGVERDGSRVVYDCAVERRPS